MAYAGSRELKKAISRLPMIMVAIILQYIGGYIGVMEKKMETTIVYWGLYNDNSNNIE